MLWRTARNIQKHSLPIDVYKRQDCNTAALSKGAYRRKNLKNDTETLHQNLSLIHIYLKMATDTLLEKPMAEAERTDFIRGIRSQTDKLDFLFQALSLIHIYFLWLYLLKKSSRSVTC